MKISELSTDKALDVLCGITPFLGSIAVDQDITAELRRTVDPENVKTKGQIMLEGMKRINILVPILLKTHRADVYGILSALYERPAEEIGRQNFMVTAGQIREITRDKELLDFFKSSVPRGKAG